MWQKAKRKQKCKTVAQAIAAVRRVLEQEKAAGLENRPWKLSLNGGGYVLPDEVDATMDP